MIKLELFTIGHSNRSFEEFLSLLLESKIQGVADVRRYPSSKKFPHFDKDALSTLLEERDIYYQWFEALGGRRHSQPSKESPNTGIRSPGFRNYADHMLTEEFKEAIKQLLEMSNRLRTAIMCAERFYWKCHRKFLSDFIVAQGLQVLHIIEIGILKPHKLTRGATLREDRTLIYPPEKSDQ